MGHGPEHHIEHAEHAAHAAHDDFNKQVTMSIAIVAAVLACVSMLGHRTHNETLFYQGEALALQTVAGKLSTDTANKWAYYQSKNVFNLESEITVDLLDVVTVRDDRKKEYLDIRKKYAKNVLEYKGKGFPEDDKEGARLSEDDKKKAEGKLKGIKREADAKENETKELLVKAEAKMQECHTAHGKAVRFDYGELGLQFGVVLCSLAILTKSRGFWFAGLISSVVGALVALTGLLGLFLPH